MPYLAIASAHFLISIVPSSARLRKHFEIDRHFVVLAALRSLADEGTIDIKKCAEAIAKYGIDADKVNPHYA